MKFSGKKLKNP